MAGDADLAAGPVDDRAAIRQLRQLGGDRLLHGRGLVVGLLPFGVLDRGRQGDDGTLRRIARLRLAVHRDLDHHGATLRSPACQGRRMKVDHQAVIVGAGFGGMGAAIALQRAGVNDFVVLEREDDLGGTWYVNHYPGLTVDIPSATYSYSFEPNADWSHVFARGTELKAYCDQVAAKHDLRSHMRFGVTVTSARWDDDADTWVVALGDGSTLTTRHL